MTDNSTPAAEAKPFLGALIDARMRDSMIEAATEVAPFIRLMALTLLWSN